jgi:hypothetical protein
MELEYGFRHAFYEIVCLKFVEFLIIVKDFLILGSKF